MTNLVLEERMLFSSYGIKNFNQMPQINDNSIVMIVNSNQPYIVIFDTTGLSESEVINLVNMELSYLTLGCNYKYEITQKIGNCFFCN